MAEARLDAAVGLCPDGSPPVPGTVADVMVRRPWVLPGTASLAQAREVLVDGHVHMVLLVTDGRLRGTVTRSDLPPATADAEPALAWAQLEGRTVAPDEPAEEVRRRMVEQGTRRLAVVDAEARLLGLLCLKRRRTGFCSDDGVAARRAERESLRARM